MNTLTLKTPWSRTSALARGLTIATLAAGAWAMSVAGSQAHARSDVHWSIGVHAPGVVVGASNHGQRGYYAPPPVYYSPPPVYYSPRPIYYAPPPVYYQPRPIYRSHWGGPRWDDRRYGHDRGHGRHGHRNDRHDRHDRDGRR